MRSESRPSGDEPDWEAGSTSSERLSRTSIEDCGGTDSDWTVLARVLEEPGSRLNDLLFATPFPPSNPAPMSPQLAARFCDVLSAMLAQQAKVWCSEAELGMAHQVCPSKTLARLAWPVRFLSGAHTQSIGRVLLEVERVFTKLSAAGRLVDEKALRETAHCIQRLRNSAHGPHLDERVHGVLNAMVPHLQGVEELGPRSLAALLAAMVNCRQTDRVAAFLDELTNHFQRFEHAPVLGANFIRSSLRGVTDLPPGNQVTAILKAVTERLEDVLTPEAAVRPEFARPYFIAAALLELGEHLGTQAGQDLACALVDRVLGPGCLPRGRFAIQEANEAWLASRLQVGMLSEASKVDLHGMSHRLAKYLVERVIAHAITKWARSGNIEFVVGASSHQRVNEGVMRSIVLGALDELRQRFPNNVGEPASFHASLVVRVKGRRGAAKDRTPASSASGAAGSRTVNSFDVLGSESSGYDLQRTSVDSVTSSRKPRRSRNKRKAGSSVSATPSHMPPAGAQPQASQSEGVLGWLKAWVGSWFKPGDA